MQIQTKEAKNKKIPSDKVELFVVERAVERFGDACLGLGKGGVVHETFSVGTVGAGNAAHVSEILAEREVAVDVQREVLVARSGHVERLVRLHHTRRAVLERFLHLLVKDRVECARGVVLRALVVGRVVQLVAEHAANAAVVERTGRIAVVERAAQNAGWQRDRVVRRIVVRVHGLWRHLPFVHCRFAEFGNVHAYRLAAQRLHIAIVVVRLLMRNTCLLYVRTSFSNILPPALSLSPSLYVLVVLTDNVTPLCCGHVSG